MATSYQTQPATGGRQVSPRGNSSETQRPHVGASEAATRRQQETSEDATRLVDSQPTTRAKADVGQQTGADNRPEASGVGGLQTVESAVAIRKITTTSQQRPPSAHQLEPLEPAQPSQLPVHIVVEPRNDESIQCHCRNCHFFSGWYCMPCAILIFIVLLIFWASTKLPRPLEAAPTQSIRNATTPAPFNRTTTPAALVNATATRTGNLLSGSDLSD